MMRCSLLVVLAMCCSGTAGAEKTEVKEETIRLDHIWAKDSPGARNIEELGKGEENKKARALFDAISVASVERLLASKKGQLPKPGFAVAGTGITALEAAHAVLVKDQKPGEKFNRATEITLVLFSTPVQGDIELIRVSRRGNLIDVQYRHAVRTERYVTSHLSLIPVGKLPAGKYQVRLTKLPSVLKLGDEYMSLKATVRTEEDRFICRPFTFQVVNTNEKAIGRPN